MKKVLNSIKYDIILNLYNKSILAITIMMVLIFSGVYWNMMESFKSNLFLYNHTYHELQDMGEDVEELLKQEANLVEEKTSDGVQQFIDNPLRYDYDNLQRSYTYIKGTNIIVGLLKNATLVFLGLLVGIYMIFIVTYEYSERTIKTRLLIDGSRRLFLSKFVSGIFIVTVVYFLSLIISWSVSFLWSEKILQSVSISFERNVFDVRQVLLSIVTTYVILLLFSMMGFVIGLFLRKMSVSILVFLVLHLVVPSFGKYDYKNLILTIFSNGFELELEERINYVDGVGVVPSIFIFLIYVFVIFVFSCFSYRIKKNKGGNV